MSVLPDNDGVIVQIGDIGSANSLRVLLHDHPANVRIQETLSDGVGILLRVGITVVSTVVP